MSSGSLPLIAPLAQAPAVAPSRIAAAAAELLERLVDWLHGFFPALNDTLFRGIVSLLIIVLAILLRRAAAKIVFGLLRRWTSRAERGAEDRYLKELLAPAAALLMVCGIYAALTVLKLGPAAALLTARGAKIALACIALWGVFRAGEAALNHLERSARDRDLGIGAFMPLIKRVLGVVFFILCLLIIAENFFGAEVKTFLAGLGIGGLAVALAAQDTIANMFGSFVVVMDRPFRVGDVVRIASSEGTVEDIGLRSTRLRTGERTQVVIPNKTVAAEAIVNFSRMPQRRVDQAIGLTYDTTPEQMEAILEDFRALLRGDPGVHPSLIAVYFAAYGESSLDIQIVYFTNDPDWPKHMAVRERINLKIMRAVAARKLAFAFPTQTVIHQGSPPS